MVAGLFTTCLLSLLLPIIVLASPHASAFAKRHHGLVRRAEGNVQLYQRQGLDRFSFYNAETGSAGSCGQFLSNSGFTVAMNAAQMQPKYCGLSITISYNGKSTTATVQDTCPGCPYGGLDLTPGLFAFFAPQSVGIIYGTWVFAGAPAPPAPSPTPTPTPTPPPPPPSPSPTPTPTPSPSPYIASAPASSSSSITSTSTPASASSSTSNTPSSSLSTTSTRNSTAALTSSSSAATSSSSIDYSSGAASGLAEPTGSNSGGTVVTPETGDNLQNLYQAFIELAAMVATARNV